MFRWKIHANTANRSADVPLSPGTCVTCSPTNNLFVSSAALDHRRRLLWPGHERAAGRVRDGARHPAVLGRRGQDVLRHRLRLQEPLAGLRGDEKRTREEGEERKRGRCAADIRFLCWDVENELGIRDRRIRGKIVVVRQIDFQANQLSRLDPPEDEVCVCVHERDREREVVRTVERI